MSISIRLANPSEAISTTKIRRDSWLSAYDHIFGKPAIIKNFEEKLSNVKYKKNTKQLILNKQMFVVCENNVPVGMMVVDKFCKNAKMLEVHALYVLPTHQRLGIGKILMNKAIEIAHQRNISTLNWFALKDNVVGNNFYQKIGGKVVSTKTNTLCGKEVELVEYNLHI